METDTPIIHAASHHAPEYFKALLDDAFPFGWSAFPELLVAPFGLSAVYRTQTASTVRSLPCFRLRGTRTSGDSFSVEVPGTSGRTSASPATWNARRANGDSRVDTSGHFLPGSVSPGVRLHEWERRPSGRRSTTLAPLFAAETCPACGHGKCAVAAAKSARRDGEAKGWA